MITTTIRRNRVVASSVATTCFVLGLAIYTFFRPTTLLMFHWVDKVGLTHSVQLIRDSVIRFENLVPEWIVSSLPFALWILAYLLFIGAIWKHSQSRVRFLWFWSVPLIAIITELAQINHVIQGSFDWKDLATIVLAIVFGFYATPIHNLNKGGRDI